MRNRNSRQLRRATIASLAVTIIAMAAGAVPAGAVDGPLDPLDTVEFVELAPPSPLTPGIDGQRHFLGELPLPIAAPDGFAYAEFNGSVATVFEVSPTGEVTTSEITADASLEGGDFTRALQLTDSYLLAEFVAIDGDFEIEGSQPIRIDRSTGETVVFAGGLDSLGAARIADDGGLVVASATVGPFWSLIVDGTWGDVGGSFQEVDFFSSQAVPSMTADGRIVAVVGSQTAGDDSVRQLRARDTTGEWDDVTIELPCPVANCDHEIGAVVTRNGEASIFFTTYSVESSFAGFERVAADHFVLQLPAGTIEPSIPVTIASPNGRFVAGPQASGNAVELDGSAFVVVDRDTGRQRTFDSDLSESYVTEILSLSNDGLTVRYRAEVPCTGRCAITDSFFGQLDLGAVADQTAGPAADQILRLYRAVFGRIPDAGGFEFWMARYRDGEPLLSIARQFAASQEFADRFGENPTDEELIVALYENTLGRAGDAGGVVFWLDRRAAGASVAELLVSFADSPENIDRTGTRAPITVPEGRVLRLYRAMLGRDPDAGGLAFWVGQSADGMSLAEMAEAFTFQSEYTTLYGESPTDEELVDAVYRNVLGRSGDAGGVAFWLDRLATGLTVPELFVSFAESPENIVNTGTVR